MDLEIADYERTVEALNSKVTERDATITELRSEVERLEEKARGLKEQIGKISRSLVQGEIIAKIVKKKKSLDVYIFAPSLFYAISHIKDYILFEKKHLWSLVASSHFKTSTFFVIRENILNICSFNDKYCGIIIVYGKSIN